MTHSLQKTLLSFFVSAFLILAFTSTSQAQEQLNTVWERTDRTGAEEAKPSWFTVGSVRGMAYNGVTDHVYTADRGNTTIQVMDAQTGDDITLATPFDLSGLSGGTFAMNDVEVSEDGVIFVGNLSSSEVNPFRLYWWSSEGGTYDDSLTIAAPYRLGDKFTVVGSLEDNTIEVWLAAPAPAETPDADGVVYVATTSDQGDSWDIETITLSGDLSTIGSSSDVAPLALGRTSDFYVGGNSTAPTRYDNSGAYIAGSELASSSRNGFEIFHSNGQDLIAVYTYRPDGENSGNKTGQAVVYNISDAASPTIVGESPLMGDDADTYSSIHGEAEVLVNSDGTYNVYALEGVNGFAAYSGTVPLAGDYYIPQGSNDQGFATFAEAIDAINQNGLSAATTLYIAEDLTETEIIKLERDDLSETNSLTVKPAPGTTPTLSVIGGSGGDGFWIETTDWVTIDGSNTVDGSTKDLTITSADSSFSAVVYVTNSSNVTVKNTIVTYTGGDTGIYGIIGDVSGSGVLSSFLVENNTVGTTAGEFRNTVTLWGSSDNPAQGSVINNIIYTSQRGITTFYNVDNTFTGNNITIANPEEDRGYFAGIYLAAMNGQTNVIGNEISGLAVNQTTEAAYAAGILINGNLDTVNVINNMVSAADFQNVGAAVGNEVFGIMLNNPAGEAEVNVYHNTVHIGSSSETGIHAAFGTEEVATGQIWDFQNNIFSVEQDDENAYAFHWPFSSADNLSSNYNNLYVSGSSASAGYFNDATTATLADWQTASGQDTNSTSVSVEFVSETDLRLAAGSIGDHDLAGTPLGSVTKDIDGTDRSETHPYKGAFEGGTPVPIENVDTKPNTFSLSQNYPNPFNPTSNIQFALPQQSNVKLEVFNINGQLVRTLVNSRMSAGEHTIQFDARDLASGIYIYRIIAGDFVQTKKMTLIK